jgi:ABC-type transport system involved in multi-copper enzyme maturation permease subunit
MVFFPSFQSGSIGQAFTNLPKALQSLVGNLDAFRTVGGYISQEIFNLRMPLLTIVLTIAVFTGLTSTDEQRGILETQLSLPLSRKKILSSKLWAGIVITLVASLGTFLGVLLGLLFIRHSYSPIIIARETLSCALISLDFGLVAFLVGAVQKSKSVTLGIASAVAFISYLITTMAPSVEKLQPIEKFSLFHYYQNLTVFSLKDTVVLIFVGVVVAAISFVAFSRRDIRT